jgi:hypothetical protein
MHRCILELIGNITRKGHAVIVKRWGSLSAAGRTSTVAGFALLVCGCGGGHGTAGSSPANYNLQAGIANMVTSGFTVNVSLSGSATVDGVSNPFTGSGTFTRAPGLSTTFDGTAGLSQSTAIAGTITVAGQSAPYSSNVTDYFASSGGSFLGETSNSEYDVAQSPIVFPTMIVGGSDGSLGTLSRYVDSTMSVSLGTEQLSYSVTAPVDPGSPIAVAVTTKIYDTQNALIETDVTNYTMTSSDVIALSGASAQTPSGMVSLTVQ